MNRFPPDTADYEDDEYDEDDDWGGDPSSGLLKFGQALRLVAAVVLIGGAFWAVTHFLPV